MNEICRISMTDDDKYVVEVTEEKKGNKKGEMPVMNFKNYVADDHDDLFELLSKYLPRIKNEKEKAEDEYDKGWNKNKEKGKTQKEE